MTRFFAGMLAIDYPETKAELMTRVVSDATTKPGKIVLGYLKPYFDSNSAAHPIL